MYEYPFEFRSNLIKSANKNPDSRRFNISIIPNAPTIDKVNDYMPLSTFQDKEMIQEFLKSGILDYDHQSILGTSKIEQAQAIIGKPEALYIDQELQVPRVDGYLYRGNRYNEEVIIPILEAEAESRNEGKAVLPTLGASVGGKIIKKTENIYDPRFKKTLNAITKIDLKHIAIAPLQKCINTETSVMKKSEDGTMLFDSYENFIKSFVESEEELAKALVAGVSTDVGAISGGQSLQKQDLEGAEKLRRATPLISLMFKSGKLTSTKSLNGIFEVLKIPTKQRIEYIKTLAKVGVKV